MKVKKIQGLSQYHLVLVKDNWVLLKEFTFFVDFLHLLYIVHREYTCSVVQGLLKPPLKEASIFGLR